MIVRPFSKSLRRMPAVGRALRTLLGGSDLYLSLGATLLRCAAGLLLSVVVGVPLGAWMAVSPRAEEFFSPLIRATYSLPKTALVPLFILWFGVGLRIALGFTLVIGIATEMSAWSTPLMPGCCVSPHSCCAGRSRSVGRRAFRLYPLVLVALLWEAVVRAGLVRPPFLPSLSTILVQMPGLLRERDLAGPLPVSLCRAATGLAIAMATGLAVGFLIARVRWARSLFGPLVAFGAPAPKIALLPVFRLALRPDDETTKSGTATPFLLALDAKHVLTRAADAAACPVRARVLAGPLREAVERRHAIAVARVGRSSA